MNLIAPEVPVPSWALHVDADDQSQIGSAIDLCRRQIQIAHPEAVNWKAQVWAKGDGFRVEVDCW